MGFFSKLFGRKKVTLSPNEFIIKQVSNGKLYGRFMVADDIIHIETGASSIRPTWGTSSDTAQQFLATAEPGTPLNIAISSYEDHDAFYIESKAKQFIGRIVWDNCSDFDILFDILQAGIHVACTLAEKGQFFAAGKNAHIWWCSVSLPWYDFWGEKDADVWTSKTGKYYHYNQSCGRACTYHMRKAEAKLRDKIACPKCLK
ncbi:hypothetical protein [Oscillibacter sp.]|uniref:hypothetical protein n=1 Tax=Oscillibacter sp. TaxID=1945593 RepID=UPI00289D1185|nr:hypothetical protein [Oscillibacter sp.]